jgi:hypothetical protein
MANFSQKVKSVWFKCVESVGQGAANLADNAKQKLSEINMESRRKDIAAELPKKLMQLWKDGVALPEELTALLTEQSELEEALAAAKAARQAKKARPALTDGSDKEVPAEETAPEAAEEENAPVAEEEAAPAEEAQPAEETATEEE